MSIVDVTVSLGLIGTEYLSGSCGAIGTSKDAARLCATGGTENLFVESDTLAPANGFVGPERSSSRFCRVVETSDGTRSWAIGWIKVSGVRWAVLNISVSFA